MLKRVIRFSAENKYLVIAGAIVAIAIATWTLRNIPLDALPELTFQHRETIDDALNFKGRFTVK